MNRKIVKKYDSEKMKFAKVNLAMGDKLNPDRYPELSNMSAAFIFDFVPCPKKTFKPEFVYIPVDLENEERSISLELQIAEWNLLWEAGHLRKDFFFESLLKELSWLKEFTDSNIYLLPNTGSPRYHTYIPLFHLLPKKTLLNFGLPLLKKGIWPPLTYNHSLDLLLQSDFEIQLSKAFAHHIWPLLNSGSKINAFSKDDPIVLLSHNLDYWLPFAYSVAEEGLRTFGRVPCEDDEQEKKLLKIKNQMPNYAEAQRPLYGGPIWYGEEEAWDATKEIVKIGDRDGKLSEIIDAVRSNRVEEDFSELWSFAREDFERKLYKKRSKVKVSFVELKDTIPVHGPYSELHENLVWEDFIAILDKKERQVVVCLRSGVTKVGEISKILGYANHSPVSKVLKKIRQKARQYFDLN